MAQHDFVIANQGFPATRADINNFLQAVATTHSGTSTPSGAVAGTIWLDTTSATAPILKYYDGTDNITLATLDHVANTVNFSDSALDLIADLTPQLGGNLDVNGNSIVSTSNGNITLTPNGTGDVVLSADTVKIGDSNANATITTDGTGDLILNTNSGSSSGSITIADGANGNITVANNGTGQIIVNAGAVGTPTIAPTGDTNTGIFFPTADTIAFTEGGTEAMRIDSSGNLGIGTTSGFSGRMTISDPNKVLNNRGNLNVFTSDSQAIDLGGQIGLGGLNGSAGAFDPYTFANLKGAKENSTSNNFAGYLALGTAVAGGDITERMRIDSSGNVGIGIVPVPPTGYNGLHVHATYPVVKLSATATGSTATDGFAVRIDSTPRVELWNFENTAMVFGTNNAERMRITSGGELLVGATSAATPTGVTSKFVSQGSFTGANFGAAISSTAATGVDHYYISFQTATNTQRGYIYYNNGAGQVQLSATSDIRLKENIVDAPSALPILNQVKVRQYDWKDTGNTNIGFIAQELYDVIPRAVAVGEDNEDGAIQRTWGVDNGTLVPYLVKAIQEQQAIIEELKTRITTLENK